MRRSRVRSPSTPPDLPAARRRRRTAGPRRASSLAAELRAAREELESFSYSVSHDLRAPVRHIDGFLRLLREELGAPSPKAAHYLETAAGAARRLGGLIEDLLAYSRAAREPLELRALDLGDLVRGVVAQYEREGGTPAVEWRIGELPRVSADQAQLRVVLAQLLGNARKFTRGRPQPRVEVRARLADKDRVEVSVSDNGVGFDPRLADRLFGVFQRLHREEEFDGNGIGLAIARRILRRHGQWIRGDAVPGEGAVFTFSLARARGR